MKKKMILNKLKDKNKTMSQDSFMKRALELVEKKGEVKGKQEMFDKLSPIVHQAVDSLKEHMQEQNESNAEIFRVYEGAMIKREKNARELCKDKTDDQLKEYLADQAVAYNSWKGAEYDGLIKLIMEIYDDVSEEEL